MNQDMLTIAWFEDFASLHVGRISTSVSVCFTSTLIKALVNERSTFNEFN